MNDTNQQNDLQAPLRNIKQDNSNRVIITLLSILLGVVSLPFILVLSLLGLTITGLAVSGDFEENTQYYQWYETYQETSDATTDKIVQISVDGVIGEATQSLSLLGSSGITHEELLTQFDQAKEDEDVKAVVLKVNSPGGSVIASEEIHAKIEQLKEAGKKVVVSMGDTAASGGYYISAPADKIFANPYTITGSLGVIFELGNYKGIADKIGYKDVVIKSGEFKDIGNPYRDMTESERKIFENLVSESYEGFVNVISEGRKMPVDKVKSIADGRIYSGKQAKEIGLIDEFGTLEDATEAAKELVGEKDINVVEYESGDISFSQLFAELKVSLSDPFGTKALMKNEGPKLQYILQ